MNKLTKEIPLTKGKFAIVDAKDYKYLSRFEWGLDSYGHVVRDIKEDGKRYRLFLHSLVIENKQGARILHYNGNKLDFRKSNLIAVHTKTISHVSKKRKNTSSKYKGVCFDKVNNKWRAIIKHNGKRHSLGRFNLEVAAAIAYNEKAKELYGEMAYQNKIQG